LNAPVCVASSSSIDRVTLSLRLTRLDALFAPHVYSAEGVAHGKPAPDIFLHAAREMGVAPRDCIVIEDSVAGVTAARAAGMAVFGFAGGSHFAETAQREALRAVGALSIFDAMADLPDMVEALRKQRAETKSDEHGA
jgi:beta-phosphoglucomutase-like phosphatase (HAD superfamily)